MAIQKKINIRIGRKITQKKKRRDFITQDIAHRVPVGVVASQATNIAARITEQKIGPTSMVLKGQLILVDKKTLEKKSVNLNLKKVEKGSIIKYTSK
jgi:hypothetical protein